MMIAGAQCYTLRNFMQTERDIRRSLERVAAIGYKTVQISGIGAIDPHILREICDKNGLQIVLTHIPEARLLYDTDAVIAEHDILGCEYVGLGSMPERYRLPDGAWYDCFVEDYLPVARKIRDAGKLFMYHNHHFEFSSLPDGRLMMDAMLEDFPADVMGITLDTYWVQAAGCDVGLWIEKLKDRIPCIHFKDMTVAGMEVRMAPLGEGNLNFPGYIAQLERTGKTKYVLVEQDTCYESPFTCLDKSYRYLAERGIR